MKLVTGMVFAGIETQQTYNEIIKIYTKGKKKMVDVLQFSATEDDKLVTFTEQEIKWVLRRKLAVIVNNWESRN